MKQKQLTYLFVILLFAIFISSITLADTHYVASGGNIQAAVDLAVDGDLIIVNVGTYLLSSSISITKNVIIRSQNGASVTFIDGNNSVRCLYLNNTGAILDGFTITHGQNLGGYGGGVQCDNGTVQNCIIENNAARDGGGVALNNSGMVINSIIRNNTADWGGGVRCFNGTVRGCLITENTATPHGGGINIWSGGTVQNCTITNNTATDGAGIRLWNNGIVENSIIYSNTGSSNYIIDAGHGNSLSYSCTTPLHTGTGNISVDPLFVNAAGGDYRLSVPSPLINAGLNTDWMNTATDLDANNRILDATVDIGAYEFKNVVLNGPVPTASWPVGNPIEYNNPPTLNWYLGASDAGITYEIQCVVASDPWPADNIYATSSTTSLTLVSGLTSGVQYKWRVRSTNGITKSAWSISELFTMVAENANEPVVPTASWPVENPTIYINPPTLNWYLGADASGLTYEIQYIVSSDPWPADNVFTTSSATSLTLASGLISGVQYAWRVRSTNGVTKSAWSTAELFTMVANTTAEPVIPIASWPIGNPTVYNNPPTLNWYLEIQATGLSYEIQCVVVGDPWPADNVFATSASNFYTFTSGLINGTQYAWRVRSTDGITKSAWSVTALFTLVANTAGEPIVPITSWPIENPTIYINPPTLNWYLNASATGLSYEIQCVVASDPWPADNVFTTSSSNSYTFTSGLTNGVQYAWRVRSTNGVTKSAWSTTALFTMVADNANEPVIPIASWPIGNTTEYTNPPTLNWYLDAYDIGLSYEIQCVVASDPWLVDNVFVTSSTHSYTLTSGLTNGVQYKWRVRSTDGATKSAWSNTALFTMAAAYSPVPPIPASPANDATINTSSPELFWYLPTAAPDQKYELSYSTSSDMSNAIIVGNIDALQYKLDNLNSGSTYYWIVRSKISDGTPSIASPKGTFKVGGTTDLNDSKKSSIPDKFNLSQNYPNPFNPTTTIQFTVVKQEVIKLVIYNTLGEEVKTLINANYAPGKYTVAFDASEFASGLYIYRISNTSTMITKKMMLLK